MKTLQNKPYRGFRKLVDRYIDTVIYLLILALIVALTTSVAHLGHDLKVLNTEIDELNGKIDILTESIRETEEEIAIYETSVLLEDKPEYHIEATYPELYTDEDVIVLTKMLWGEARGINELHVGGRYISGKCQQAAVFWTVLNRKAAG